MKITVIGCGYVGLSWAVYFSKNNYVKVWDINSEKIKKIENRVCPFLDKDLSNALQDKSINLNTIKHQDEIYFDTDVYIVAVPTDFDEELGELNTSIVDNIVSNLVAKTKDFKGIVIKSTLPVGFTKKLREKCNCEKIYYMPEFLREGRAYYDCCNPSRIIVGGATANEFSYIAEHFNTSNVDVIYMNLSEAEAVKLFSNAYLAMRVAFFNEVDSFAENKELNSKNIIQGICSDERIGNHYNNPSFGYGGYCLPKDTKQLLKSLMNKDDCLIRAIIEENVERKQHCVDKIKNTGIERIGVFRLVTKIGSDNVRNSSMIDLIIELLKQTNASFTIYEPLVQETQLFKSYGDRVKYVSTLEKLDDQSDIILANRRDKELLPFERKVYTRDIFNKD